jgi:hypothetical protein
MAKRAPRRRASEERPANAAIDLDERKERVLHTRVPESLDRQLRSRARNLGLSVSTVVRHVLLNTFGLVEDIVTDSTNVALSITGDDSAAMRRRDTAANGEGDAGVVAWQEAVLNLNGVCERCNVVLPKGTRAAIGVRARPGRCPILCRRCLGKLAVASSDEGARTSARRRRADEET